MNAPTAEGVDFTPSVDVFDCSDKYIVHVSLPGAKKSDLSLDYDADESVLHLAGVVYRPGVNEDLHQALVMEERRQDVGVFEREVRLGTRVAPAFVIVDGISAKLEDGVLSVTLPKIVQHPEIGKKKVFVEDGDLENEKEALVVHERTLTPLESEGSDVEDGEAREFVKVLVQ
jgi:HSP20 family protein